MTYGKYTILFEKEGELLKIAKIWFGADGSYYVTSPYHPAKRAHAFIRTVNYLGQPIAGSGRKLIDEAVVDDEGKRLKMSHHPDGFLQFSGQGIISGRDPAGLPKGIGIKTWPLTQPQAGPAFGMTIVGVEKYQTATTVPRNAIIFRESDLAPLPGSEGLIFEGFYRPGGWRRFLESDDQGGWRLHQVHPTGALMELRCLLASQKCTLPGFIGMHAMRARVYVEGEDSGFILSGSTGNLRYVNRELMGDGIYCAYPAAIMGDSRSLNLVLNDPPYRIAEGLPEDALKPKAIQIAEAIEKLAHQQDSADS